MRLHPSHCRRHTKTPFALAAAGHRPLTRQSRSTFPMPVQVPDEEKTERREEGASLYARIESQLRVLFYAMFERNRNKTHPFIQLSTCMHARCVPVSCFRSSDGDPPLSDIIHSGCQSACSLANRRVKLREVTWKPARLLSFTGRKNPKDRA